MRFLLTILLLAIITPPIWADGLAYGSLFPVIRETNQTALIHLGKQQVDVDMYIAIDGIPAGQTLTYILPFWQQPEGFTLEEIDSQKFYDSHTKAYWDRAAEERMLARNTSSKLMIKIAAVLGIFAGGPVNAFSSLATIAFIPTLGGPLRMQPLTTITCPAATAKLFKVESKADLQLLLAQAHLPAEYAKRLARYHTQFYAVMQLHGLAKKDKHAPPRGVHYHFFHRVTSGKTAYSYIYPLGTGGAWAKPILLTEVYVMCEPDSYVSVTAPTIGKNTFYPKFVENFDMYKVFNDSDLQELVGAKVPLSSLSATSTLLPSPLHYPAVWHRAYLVSNPTDDITVQVQARPLIDTVLRLFASPYLALALCLLLTFLSFRFAVNRVIRPTYAASGSPRTLDQHIRRLVYGVLAANVCAGLAAPIPSILLGLLSPGLIIGGPVIGIVVWHYVIKYVDGPLPAGTIKQAAYHCMGFYVGGVVILMIFAACVDGWR